MYRFLCSGFYISLMILALVPGPAYAQQNTRDSLESAIRSHTTEDRVRVDLLNRLSLHFSRSAPKVSFKYAEEAVTLADKLNYREGAAAAYRLLSMYYKVQVNSVKCMQYALLSLKEYERLDIREEMGASYRQVATAYYVGRDFDNALHHFRIALAWDKQIGDRISTARDFLGMGLIHEIQQRYDSALVYSRKAAEIFEAENVSEADLAHAYNNVGSAYIFLGQHGPGLVYYHKAVPLAIASDNKEMLSLLYQNIGQVYYETEKYSQSEYYLKKANDMAGALGDIRRKEQVLHVLKQMEESRGNYKAAYEYLTTVWVLHDTLFAEERMRQLAELQMLYNSEKKENTIRLLEQEKRTEAIWRNFLIAGTLLVLIAAVLIYYLQRSRAKKTSQLLALQQVMNAKLTEVDKLKSRFFAHISHEFRTPLTLIIGPLEEQLKQNTDQQGKEVTLMMRRNAHRLLELVNQLLDLSKLEAGKMSLCVRQGQLGEFLKVLSASFDSLAQHKQITFIKKLPSDQPVWYDKDKVEKIVTNLLSNAFKFTPSHGTVILTVTTKDSQSLQITVSDTGSGIPEEEQDQVFEPFYQARQAERIQQMGTGLGLSLVKELVKVYGGDIKLQSKYGVGSVFSVQLPAARELFLESQIDESEGEDLFVNGYALTDHTAPVNHIKVELKEQSPQPDTVLVVEDNVDLREFIASVLRGSFTVITACDAGEAMATAIRVVPGLILTDLMMPGADGISLTQQLKNDERTSHIPVILLTARNEHESRLQGFKTGVDDFLTKPFSNEELLARITNLIHQRKRLAELFREKILVPATSLADNSMEEKFLLKLRTVVEENLSDFNFNVELMAEEMNLSRTQLLRKLKALTGLSPNEFIKDIRMKKASDMIRQKTDTITQIGYAVGFNDQSYFTKCFKKHFGVTPSEYALQADATEAVQP